MKFKLVSGKHSTRVNKKVTKYVKGDIIETDRDLVKSFGTKFFRLPEDTVIHTTDEDKVVDEDVIIEEEEKANGDGAADFMLDEDEDEDIDDSSGNDLPALDITVEKKGSRFNIYRADTGEKLNEKGLTKSKKDELLKNLGNINIME